MRKVATAGAVLVGAKEFKGHFDTFIGKYRRSLGECNEIKRQLNHLRNDIEEQRQMHEENIIMHSCFKNPGGDGYQMWLVTKGCTWPLERIVAGDGAGGQGGLLRAGQFRLRA